jgi:hypothetical protein
LFGFSKGFFSQFFSPSPGAGPTIRGPAATLLAVAWA